jgi:DNA-binding response OmpR family regulator
MIPVLWVDDELRICTTAVRVLGKHGFAVEAHTDPEEFMRAARSRLHRILVADWNLRTCEGSALLSKLRLEGDKRLMALLSGKLATDHAREIAKECGADDFIEKTAIETWAPSLEAMLRLPATRRVSGVVRVELDGNVLKVWNYAAKLGAKERAVVEFLLEDPNRERSLEEIALRVWGRHGEPETTLVESTISRIREKLGAERDLIERGAIGWRIRAYVKMDVKNLK